MGCLISFVIGGALGIFVMCLMTATRDEQYNKKLIKRLKDEIYEEIHSSTEQEEE